MSMFSIRIELHDASWQQYVDLANDLAAKGITDVVVADDGTSYKLPPAEYNHVGTASINAVYNAAAASAVKTGKRHAVVVSETARRMWTGLQPIAARRSA